MLVSTSRRYLHCVAVCCSVLQYVAICSYVECVSVCFSVFQCVSVCFSVLQSHTVSQMLGSASHRYLQCVTVCYSVLQCVAVPYCITGARQLLTKADVVRCNRFDRVCGRDSILVTRDRRDSNYNDNISGETLITIIRAREITLEGRLRPITITLKTVTQQIRMSASTRRTEQCISARMQTNRSLTTNQ